jgi:hypothetical protein
MTTADLLSDLGSTSDIAGLVQRVSQERLPWIVVSRAAVTHWTAHDPEGWAKVVAWLRERGVASSRSEAVQEAGRSGVASV